MSAPVTLVVHALHVAAGIVWAGGAVFMWLFGWPALLRRPPGDALPHLARFGRAMAIAGSLVVVLGVVRGTVLGPVRSLDYLASSAYGRTFALALALSLALAAHGAVTGRTLERKLVDGERWRADAARVVRRDNAITIATLAAIVACMCAMHFGL